jgi:hypothetical protein
MEAAQRKKKRGLSGYYSLRNVHLSKISHRSTSLDNLHVQRPNTNFGKRTFQYSGIILWNSLPLTLKECKNLELFKRHYYTLCKFLTLSIHFIGQAAFVNFH